MTGAIFIGVLLLTASVGLLAFAHVTASALRLLAASNGVAQLQVEAALDVAALITRDELTQFVAPPHPDTLPIFTFEGTDVFRTLTWDTHPNGFHVTVHFATQGAARNIMYEVSPGTASFLSYQ